ncbi:MAG: helix-turn-helix transcriptional regulator [Deltaproteobacteria bacterium]|nr:helix-turn-helix transcriptional regulator [Deltaproteobacteria bacterium]
MARRRGPARTPSAPSPRPGRTRHGHRAGPDRHALRYKQVRGTGSGRGRRSPPSPLRRIRGAYGLRAVEIAAASGVSVDTVRRIGRLDVATPQLASLLRMAHALGLAPTELVPGLGRRPGRPRSAHSETGKSRKTACTPT